LRNDIGVAFNHVTASAAAQRAQRVGQTDRELRAYFAADRRVEADCKAAGHGIGPLKP
jgi:hypothetical protein